MHSTITVGDGPWHVQLIGTHWFVYNVEKRGRKAQRRIGPARTRGKNYFDLAMAEAEKRNAEHTRKNEKFTLDEAPQRELDAMVRSESGNQ